MGCHLYKIFKLSDFFLQIKLKCINRCRKYTFNHKHLLLLQIMSRHQGGFLRLQSGVYLSMCELTSLSLKVTQSLILAAFSSITFASWALTKICIQRKQGLWIISNYIL